MIIRKDRSIFEAALKHPGADLKGEAFADAECLVYLVKSGYLEESEAAWLTVEGYLAMFDLTWIGLWYEIKPGARPTFTFESAEPSGLTTDGLARLECAAAELLSKGRLELRKAGKNIYQVCAP